MDLPQSYIHVPPTFQVTADVHAPYLAPAVSDCITTTVHTPLPTVSTLVQPTLAATPAVVAPTATVSTVTTDILPTPVTLSLDTVVPAPTQCTLPMVLPTAPALATAGTTAVRW